MSEVYQGEDQMFQAGYALDWYPVRVVPEAADAPLSVNDPWRLRIERANGREDLFVDVDKSMDGPVLVLSKMFDPAFTTEIAKDKVVNVIVEYGAEAVVRPRLFHKLILQKEFREARTNET